MLKRSYVNSDPVFSKFGGKHTTVKLHNRRVTTLICDDGSVVLRFKNLDKEITPYKVCAGTSLSYNFRGITVTYLKLSKEAYKALVYTGIDVIGKFMV